MALVDFQPLSNVHLYAALKLILLKRYNIHRLAFKHRNQQPSLLLRALSSVMLSSQIDQPSLHPFQTTINSEAK